MLWRRVGCVVAARTPATRTGCSHLSSPRKARRGLATGPATEKPPSPSSHAGGAEGSTGGGGGGLDSTKLAKAGGIGLFAGVFGSLVGMGGAFVMIPALTGIIGVTQHQAHGTSLAAVMATGAGGALSFYKAGELDFEAAAYVAGMGMLTARAGAKMTSKLSAATLKRAQGWFQIVIAPTVPFREEILAFVGKGGGGGAGAGGLGGGEVGAGARAAQPGTASSLSAAAAAAAGGRSSSTSGSPTYSNDTDKGATGTPAAALTAPSPATRGGSGAQTTTDSATVTPTGGGAKKDGAAEAVIKATPSTTAATPTTPTTGHPASTATTATTRRRSTRRRTQRSEEEEDQRRLQEEQQQRDNPWARRVQLMSIGVGSGFLTGIFGVGGGSIVVPALSICLDVGHHLALGTSLAAMVPTALVGTYTHARQGNVVYSVVAPLALGSAVGSYVGGEHLALRIPEEPLRWVFFFTMVILGGMSVRSAGAVSAAQRAGNGASAVARSKGVGKM